MKRFFSFSFLFALLGKDLYDVDPTLGSGLGGFDIMVRRPSGMHVPVVYICLIFSFFPYLSLCFISYFSPIPTAPMETPIIRDT